MKNARLSIVLTAVLLAACAKTPFTGSQGLNLIPEATMIQQSEVAYREMIQQGKTLDNDIEGQMVQTVADNLIDATERYFRQTNNLKAIAGFKWEVHLMDDPTVNAFCMPGGLMVVNSGILPVLRDDNGLAIVLGHEIAHAIARHGNRRVSQAIMLQAGAVAVDVATYNQDYRTRQAISQAYGIGSAVGVMLPYSRKHELEADEIGLYLASMAGYDPAAGPRVWESMAQLGGKTPAFLSTHPSDDKRAQKLREYQPAARDYATRYGVKQRNEDGPGKQNSAFAGTDAPKKTTSSDPAPTQPASSLVGGSSLTNGRTAAKPADTKTGTAPASATKTAEKPADKTAANAKTSLPPIPGADPFAAGSIDAKSTVAGEGAFRSSATGQKGARYRVELHFSGKYDPNRAEYKTLHTEGHAITVELMLDKNMYRMLAGDFDTKEKAEVLAKRAKELGFSNVYIVRYQDNDRVDKKYF